MTQQTNQDLEQILSKAQIFEIKNDWKSAISVYRSVLQLSPNHLEAHHNLAIALRHDNQLEKSLISASFAANLAPEHPIVQFSLGVSLEKMEKITDAIRAYRASIKIRPNYVTALSNLGRLLELKGKTADAIKVLERALSLMPNSIEATINLSNSYLSAGKPQKTADILEPLIKRNDKKSQASLSLALNSLAISCHILGKTDDAVKYVKIAIQKLPNFAEAHENLAQILLYQGKYEQAWNEYEWRWRNQSNQQSKQKFHGKPWRGEEISGKILLVYAEQGFGDVIQFVRFLSMIPIKKGKLILACHTSLINLLSTLPFIHKAIDIRGELPKYDRHIALLSLPRLLNITEANVPSLPYLSANTTAIIADSDKIKIGLTWAGTTRHKSDPYRNRSCPIETFIPLIGIPGIELFSLQTGPSKFDLVKINTTKSITDLSDHIESFEDTAALICNLDIIITIDTAVAHLTGSLGKTVWILLPKSSDWRWNPRSGKNLWYPTARIFKQKSPGNWSEPLKDMTRHLKTLIP